MCAASSEAYDRGGKFEQYRKLASLSNYLLIAQDRVLIEYFSRQPDDRWLLATSTNLDELLPIDSIGCQLSVRELYLNLTLASPDAL